MLFNGFQIFIFWGLGIFLSDQQLGIAQNDSQRIVDLMCNA